MGLWSYLRRKASRAKSRSGHKARMPRGRRLHLQPLEERTLLSVVSIVADDDEASEEPGAGGLTDPGHFTVYRSGGEWDYVEVGLTMTLNGGPDYLGQYSLVSDTYLDYRDGKVWFYVTSNPASVGITVRPVNDYYREDLQTLNITISDVYGGCEPGSIGSPSTASITIEDNDWWTMSVEGTDTQAEEAGATEPQDYAAFKLTRSGETDLTNDSFVNLRYSGSAVALEDYTLVPDFRCSIGDPYYEDGELWYPVSATIPAGSFSQTIELRPVNDAAMEPIENAVFRVLPHGNYAVGAEQATIQVLDNDQWIVDIEATDPEAAEASAAAPNPGTFTITRSGETDLTYPLDVLVAYYGGTARYVRAYNDPNDGILPDFDLSFPEEVGATESHTVQIPAGATTAAVVDVLPINDNCREEHGETVLVGVLEHSGGGCNGGYTRGTSCATVTIDDNDHWVVSMQISDALA